MHPLTSYDLWKTTPPDDDSEAWEAYRDKYHPQATALVLDHLTETLPHSLATATHVDVNRRCAQLLAALDDELVLDWARKLTNDIPSFDDWAHPERVA